MKTRTRPSQTDAYRYEDEVETGLDLDSLSDDELESLLFTEEETTDKGLWNLPTMAGLSMILVGIVYIFEQLGWSGIGIGEFAEILPWIGAVFIILLGFGVLSRPKRKKAKKVKVKKKVDRSSGKEKLFVESPKANGKKRLVKSRDKKIAGVAGGLADYLNLDPTLVRIAFVILTLFNGIGLGAYLIMAFIMPKPEMTLEERITIIRDS